MGTIDSYMNLQNMHYMQLEDKKMITNKSVNAWIEEMKALVNPDNVVLIDGSEEQLEALRAEAVKTGEMIKLNQDLLPGCYLHRWQRNCTMYENLDEAYRIGTIFPELNKPFTGRRCR